MSGLQVLGMLRSKHTPAELPVIMVTAGDQCEDVVGSLKAGANDYVGKPLDFPVVLARIDAQLALKRANEQVHRPRPRPGAAQTSSFRGTFGRYLSDEIVTGRCSRAARP
jgi:DNA-binding response OmpR family regulator